MRHAVWEALLRHIPEDQQNQYMLVTASGTEIALQRFLRIEADFFIVKGRLAGSQEQGRVFVLPYDHIDYFGTSQPLKDTEFQERFDGLVLPREDQASSSTSLAASSVASPSPSLSGHSIEIPPPVGTSGSVERKPGSSTSIERPRTNIRSEVLERFRNRGTVSGPSSSGNLPRPNGL